MLSAADVIEMARTGRLAPVPNFRGCSAHGTTFERLAQQLLFTFQVRRDPRPEHSKGSIAITQNRGGEVYRIDFDLAAGPDDEIILIVTGWNYGD